MNKNLGFCNLCGKLVPVNPVDRDNKVFLVKECPDCGTHESLISSNARRYRAKAVLDIVPNYIGCRMDCTHCPIPKTPNVVFVDLTNRCNLNCPCCINNTPSMGFLFEPPIEYFDKIFRHISQYNPRPHLQLFGGEPTVRKDLLEIVRLAKSYGLAPRIVTNGLALADEEYCRKVLETRATICFAYDNDNPEVYRAFRGTDKVLATKIKALDNIGKFPGGAKVVLMSLIAVGYNEKDVARLLEFAHKRIKYVRAIYFMPLAHNWRTDEFNIQVERINTEMVEDLVEQQFPGQTIEFLPAGLFGQLRTMLKYLGVKPLPFFGAHPNCESMYMLFSDGERLLPFNYFVRGSLYAFAQDMVDAEKRLAAAEANMDKTFWGRLWKRLRLRNDVMRLRAVVSLFRILNRHLYKSRIIKGKGLGKWKNGLMAAVDLLLGRPKVFARRSAIQAEMQIVILPFEDSYNLETHRLERCPAAFAYVDPDDGEVKHVSVCAWGVHKTPIMREIAEYYSRQTAPEATTAAT
ncbi:MAG: radical SAM protein [Candidatus Sumerlaeia bacterium]|nr:radical SAM protein [Candidatus Sumerlaeia bacterium]